MYYMCIQREIKREKEREREREREKGMCVYIPWFVQKALYRILEATQHPSTPRVIRVIRIIREDGERHINMV